MCAFIRLSQLKEKVKVDEYSDNTAQVLRWSTAALSSWLGDNSYPELADIFEAHQIEGKHLPFLNDYLLAEMGINKIGVRIGVLEDLRKLQTSARTQWRKQVHFQQDEYRLGPCGGFLPYRCNYFPCCLDTCTPPLLLRHMYSSLQRRVSVTIDHQARGAWPGIPQAFRFARNTS